MSTTPVPPPQKQTNWLVWILGIGAVAIVLFVLGGLMVAGFIVRGLRVDRAGRQVQVSTPAGEITVRQGRLTEVGLPVYPGATLAEPGASVEFTPSEEVAAEKVGVNGVKYHTTDSLEKVDAWYRERLGPDYEREGPGGKRVHVRMGGITIESDDIAYVHEKDDLVHLIAIKRRGTGAEIALVRIGKQETQ